MGLAHSPRIVTDGLVLALDAANTKNYNLTAVEVLVVAGGGGGGMDMGGGGGGGGVIFSSAFSITPGSAITATVGNGGVGAPAAGTNGQPGAHQYTISATQGGNSVFGSLTAIGGGFGASSYYGYTPNFGYGGTGGSGGGCSGYTHGGERYVDGTNNSTANNTAGQGFVGGNSGNPSSGGDDHYSGGGGGAGGRGTSGPNHIGPNGIRGDGGPGVLYSLMSSYYFAGGGGGSGYSGNGGYGGIGGGGGGSASNGNIGLAGTGGINIGSNGSSGNNAPGGNAGANTGGGGGGGSHYNANNKGGDGGSGIIIVRYPGAQRATGGTVTSNNGYTIHTFITSGTFTPLVATNNSAILGIPDFSGRNNFATAVSGPTYSSGHGGSLSFNGSSQYATITSGGIITNDISVDIWFIVNSAKAYTALLGSNATEKYEMLIKSASNLEISLAPGNYIQHNNILSINTWTNIVVSASNGVAWKVYKNGVDLGNPPTIAGTYQISGTGVSTIDQGRIRNDVGSFGFSGNISSTKIYNRALSAAEISQNYNALKGRFNPSQYETLTYTASGNLTVTGNGTNTVDIFKTSGGAAWDNQAYSTTAFTAPCTIEFNKQAASGDNGVSYAMIGWNVDPTTDASYSSIDYASYPYSQSLYYIYHNGSGINPGTSWNSALKLYVVYGTDGFIRHYNGSTLLYSANYGTGNTVYVDSSFYSPNATFGGFSNIKVSRSAWNGSTYVNI